jgi:hypothetical protein
MPDDHLEAEAALAKLGEHLHESWAQRHPLAEDHLAAVRKAVKLQWEQEQKTKAAQAQAKKEAEISAKKSQQDIQASQDQNKRTKGPSHDQSH